MLVDCLEDARTLEWHFAGQAFIHQTTERIDVGPGVQCFAETLLGAHIERAAENIAGLSQLGFGHFRLHDFRDPEVDDFDDFIAVLIFYQHDVAWFQIAMDHCHVVRMTEGIADLCEYLEGAPQRERTLGNQLSQGFSLDQIHDQIRFTLLRYFELVHLDDVLVIEPADRDCLLLKSQTLLLVDAQLRRENFDGDNLFQQLVTGAKDRAHAAAPDKGEDFVMVTDDSANQLLHLWIEGAVFNCFALMRLIDLDLAAVCTDFLGLGLCRSFLVFDGGVGRFDVCGCFFFFQFVRHLQFHAA